MNYKKYLSWLLVLGFLGLAAWYGLTHHGMFSALLKIAPLWIALLFIGRLLTIYSNGLFTKTTVEAFSGKMSQAEGFKISVLTAVGNFFGPLFGGLGIRAIYLKKVHNLSYSHFTSSLIGYYLLMFLFNSLVAIFGVLLLPKTGLSGLLLLIFGAWFVVFLAMAFIRLPKPDKTAFLKKKRIGALLHKVLYDIDGGWKLLKNDRALLLKMAALALFNLVTIGLMTYIEFLSLSIPVTLGALLLYTAITQVSILLSVTPGAIGFREAILLLLAATLSVNAHDIFQIAVVDRAVQFILIIVLVLLTRHSKFRQSVEETSA